jgi:hypothetical protein
VLDFRQRFLKPLNLPDWVTPVLTAPTPYGAGFPAVHFVNQIPFSMISSPLKK